MAASVAGNLIGGAALGAAFQLLFTEVQTAIQLARAFKGELENLDKKLKSLDPLVKKMIQTNMELDLSLSNTTNFEAEMKKGTLLVAKSKSLSSWKKAYKRPGHTKKLRKFDKYLDELGKILGLQLGVDTLTIAGVVKSTVERLEKQENMAPARMVRDRGGVPQPQQFVIGLDKPLGELKMKILREDGSVLVLNAHPGCGKTTLAQKLCNDSEIQGKFGSNIMFVEVSKTADLNLIVRRLYEQKGFAVPRDGDDARKSLELLLKEIGPGPILLVLDDVWSESKYIIEKFMFDDIPEYKILVTSRFEFPALGPTFKLETLDNEDAMKLFRFYAKLEDQNSNIPDELVEEVVQRCKRVPLALILIGRSLCGRPREIWHSELKEWSKQDSSVLDFESELLLCLKRSLDIFDQKDEVLKECFLDLGSYPEDTRIPATALIDLWTELYRRDEEDATAYLFKLSEFNLADVMVTRKDVDEDDYYYSEHFVTLHGMLRELAIHLSRQDPETQRKRLILELNEKNLRDRWNELNERTFHAHLVSITTDGNFSSNWCNMNLPEAEVLILNFQSENYALPDFLKNMSKLKVLIITNYGFFPANLSNFELLGSLTNLKRIRFERVVIPPLSKTFIKLENLQKLSLFMCTVGQAFDSIQRSKPFPKLEELNIDYCRDFVALPAEFCDTVKNVLRKLSITHCHKLSTLPEEIGEMDHLEVLRLRSSIDLESLPDSICSLSSLKFLDISDCFSIRNLPEEIGNLSRLEKLNMNGCSRLPELPPSVLDFERLKEVVCDEELEELWESSLPSHRSISLKVAKPDSICNLSSLNFLDISDCFSIWDLPKEIVNLRCLEKLNLNGCSRQGGVFADKMLKTEIVEHIKEYERGSTAFFATNRPSMPLDIFSCPLPLTSEKDELNMTDGESYNYNGQVIPSAALKIILNHPKLSPEGKEADVDSGRLSGMIFVSERDDLETLHLALCFNDYPHEIKVFSLDDVFGTLAFNGVHMVDSCCVAGDYLVYAITDNTAYGRKPWTTVFKTHLKTGKTYRITPSGHADLSPSVSPSGKMIAVASSQRNDDWDGKIEDLKTDIYVMNVEEPLDRKFVVVNGGWPTWGSDDIIFFHRKVGEFWGVFRADISKGHTSIPLRVTPDGVDAITPAAIDATTVAVATIRQKSQLDDIHVEEQYRHIEIFYSTGGRQPIQVTEKTRPTAHHFSPFVIDGGKRIGYHRCKSDPLKVLKNMEEQTRGAIVFFSTYRPAVPLDIFSCPVPWSSKKRYELHMTDGASYNYNGQVIPSAALKKILKRPKLALEGKEADVDSGHLSGMIFVSERNNLETLHIALQFNHGPPKVFSFADVFDTFNGVRMEDSGCVAGDYLVYVTTKDVAPNRRQPWTTVYRTNLITGKSDRITPPGQADLSPSVSPSGKMIAVASFERKGSWDGEIEDLKTDIFVMNVEEPFKRKLAVLNGGWPTWGSDSVIFFHRKVGEFWGVFRAEISKLGLTDSRVTPEGVDAITPAAIDATTVAVAIIRQKSQFNDVRVEAQYRHIEIFYSNGQKQPIQITQKTRPKADHFNPFVMDGGKRIGYHRCNSDVLMSGPEIPRQFDKLDSPLPGVGLVRLSGVFPTFSKDGSKLAFVVNEFKAVWVADIMGSSRVVHSTKDDNVFSLAWNQNPDKDTLYICVGTSFHAKEALQICAIKNVSRGKRQRQILTRFANNAFPSTNPDGTKLVFRSTRGGDERYKNLYLMEDVQLGDYADSEEPIRRLTNGPWTDTHCQWSPRGDWIVFSSNRDKPEDAPETDNNLDPGYFAVFLVKWDDPSVVVRVVGSGNDLAGHVNRPFFSLDGKSIVVTADLAAVSVDPTSLPFFLHSVRPFGEIFSIDIDTNDIKKNKDVKTFNRITHSRYENATASWTMLSTQDPNAAWKLRHLDKKLHSDMPLCSS